MRTENERELNLHCRSPSKLYAKPASSTIATIIVLTNCRILFLCFIGTDLFQVFPSLQAEILVPDAELTIPREDLFDELKEVTLDEINAIGLYPRYPASWKVIDLTAGWKCGSLKTDVRLSDHELEVRKNKAEEIEVEEDPFTQPTESEAKDGEIADAQKESEALKTPSNGSAADLTDEQVLAETRKVQKSGVSVKLPSNPRAEIVTGQSMAVVSFVLEEELYRGRQSYLLHFNRGNFTSVYVNSRRAFGRVNSFCPFTGDISVFVREGKNTIAMLEGSPSLFRESEVIVAPVRYVKEMLLTTDTSQDTLHLDLVIQNNGPSYKGKLIARINSWKSQNKASEFPKDVALKTGENRLTWMIKMESPLYWSPENPHLYELHLSDEDGNALGRERFGFRDFTTRGAHFFLNGKRIKLFGNCNLDIGKHGYLKCVRLQPGEYLNVYEKRAYFAYLKGLKAAGLNCNLQYGKYDKGRGYYEACDELGILAYVRFPAWGVRLKTKSDDPAKHMSKMSEACEEYLHHLYNHPSFVMLSFGAELYDARPENLAAVYDYLKPRDRQRRPTCSSSGRIRVQLNLKQKDKTDVADDHSYWGTLKGSWLKNRGYFAGLKKDVEAVYGKDALPLTSFECLDANWRYDVQAVTSGVNRLLTEPRLDKAAYARMVNEDFYFGDGTMVLRLASAHGQGLREHYTDEGYMHRSLARMWKRIIEVYRQEGDLEGWGAFHIERFIMYAHNNRNTLAAAKNSVPGLKIERTGIDVTRKAFIKTPAYYMVKRCYSPELISARWFDRNLIAGRGTLRATLYLNKDTAGTHDYAVRVLFRKSTEPEINARTIDFGTLTGFETKTAEYEHPIPADLPSGEYQLELFLFRDGARINDNSYIVRVFAPAQVKSKVRTEKPVAVYLGQQREPDAGLSDWVKRLIVSAQRNTRPMLDSMGLSYTVAEDLSNLKGHKILILGAHSLDDQVAHAGDAIRQWIELGGRLLSFEQSRLGALPWLPTTSVVRATRTTSADLVDNTHPAFRELEQKHFDTLSGNGALFTNLLQPLDGTVVAAAGDYVLRTPFMRPVLSDVAMNDGIAVMCQFDVSRRYGTDAVATVLANNLVNYIVSDERGFSCTPAGKHNISVNAANCRIIDISKAANAGFRLQDEDEDDDALLIPDQDAAEKDLRNIPVGRQSFKGVPFKILDSGDDEQDACIQLDLVNDTETVRVNARYAKLFFLHTALKTEAETGVPAYSFTIRYVDGKEETLTIKNGMHVSPQPHLDNLPNSYLTWREKSGKLASVGVYLTEWVNPWPAAEIKSIDFVLKYEGIAVLGAITGYWEKGEEGWK